MLIKNAGEKEISHFYPMIGRGNIAHDTVSHAKVERRLMNSFYRTIREWFCHLFDW